MAFVGCQAKEAEARGGGDPCESFLGSILNECVVHPDQSVKPRMEVGIGADLPLWKTEKLIVDQETKIDLNSGNGTWKKSNIATYTVFKPQLEKGIFQSIGDFFSNLFNRD